MHAPSPALTPTPTPSSPAPSPLPVSAQTAPRPSAIPIRRLSPLLTRREAGGRSPCHPCHPCRPSAPSTPQPRIIPGLPPMTPQKAAKTAKTANTPPSPPSLPPPCSFSSLCSALASSAAQCRHLERRTAMLRRPLRRRSRCRSQRHAAEPLHLCWTLSHVQWRFVHAHRRFSFYVGGVGAGKTTAGALRAIPARSTTPAPRPHRRAHVSHAARRHRSAPSSPLPDELKSPIYTSPRGA